MKKLILLLLLTGITSSIFAQLPSSNTTFGVKGGLNLSNYDYKIESPTIEADARIVKSFNFSGYANVPISPFLSIQAGLAVNGKGSEVESKRVTPGLSGGISGNNKQPGAGDPIIKDPIIIGPIKDVKNIPTVEDNFLSIEIPLNLVAFLKTGPGHFFIGGGPYVAYNVSGKRTVTDTEADLKFGKEFTDNLKPLDYGVNALAGYQFKSGFNFGAGYGFGLEDLVPEESSALNSEIRNRVISFSIGYTF